MKVKNDDAAEMKPISAANITTTVQCENEKCNFNKGGLCTSQSIKIRKCTFSDLEPFDSTTVWVCCNEREKPARITCGSCPAGKTERVVGNGITEPPYVFLVRCPYEKTYYKHQDDECCHETERIDNNA